LRVEWDASVRAMVARLRELPPAKEGFVLESGVTVLDPVKYHARLLDEAEAGKKSARSRMGSFQNELRQYLKVRGERWNTKSAKSATGGA
jgi:hypothetical protein